MHSRAEWVKRTKHHAYQAKVHVILLNAKAILSISVFDIKLQGSQYSTVLSIPACFDEFLILQFS